MQHTRQKIARARSKARTEEEHCAVHVLDQMLTQAGDDEYVAGLMDDMQSAKTEDGGRDERRSHRALVRAGLVGFEI